VKDGEGRRFSPPRDESKRSQHPERLRARAFELQPKVVHSPFNSQSVGELNSFRGIDVIVGDRETKGLALRYPDELCGTLVDGEHAVIAQPADDRRNRVAVEQLRVRIVPFCRE
jgi:hypothetical protein